MPKIIPEKARAEICNGNQILAISFDSHVGRYDREAPDSGACNKTIFEKEI